MGKRSNTLVKFDIVLREVTASIIILQNILTYLLPVSYTHLDVYKRQTLADLERRRKNQE